MSAKVALAENVLFCDSASNKRMPANRPFEIVRALLVRGYSVSFDGTPRRRKQPAHGPRITSGNLQSRLIRE